VVFYAMAGIAISGGNLISLFRPMGYEGATIGSTIAFKTLWALTVTGVAAPYYSAYDSRLFRPVFVVWLGTWSCFLLTAVVLDLTLIPSSSMQLSVLVEMLAMALGAFHSVGVLLTGLAIGGRKHVVKYLLAFAPGVMAVCLYVVFPVVDLVVLADDTLVLSLIRPALFLATKRAAMALQYKTFDLVPSVDATLLGLVVVAVNVAMLNSRAVSGIASWSALGVFLAFDMLSFVIRCWVHSDFLCVYCGQDAANSGSGDVAAGRVCWRLQAELQPNGSRRPVKPRCLKRLARAWPTAPAGTSESLVSHLVLHFEGEIQTAVHLHYLVFLFPLMQIESVGLTDHPLAAFWFPRGTTTGLFLLVMFVVDLMQAMCIRFMFRLPESDLAARRGLFQAWTSRKKMLTFASACWVGAFIPSMTDWVVYWALQLKASARGHLGSDDLLQNATVMLNATTGNSSNATY
jgi:hypothetical protein